MWVPWGQGTDLFVCISPSSTPGVSKEGPFCLSETDVPYLAMSGDILGCHDWGSGCYQHPVGGARDAAKSPPPPPVHRSASPSTEVSGPKCQQSGVGKLIYTVLSTGLRNVSGMSQCWVMGVWVCHSSKSGRDWKEKDTQEECRVHQKHICMHSLIWPS